VLSEEVVDGVSRNPDHGGEGHAEAQAVRPQRVLLVLAVLHRAPEDDIRNEDDLR